MRLAVVLSLLLLSACQMSLPGTGGGDAPAAAGLADEAITVTPLQDVGGAPDTAEPPAVPAPAAESTAPADDAAQPAKATETEPEPAAEQAAPAPVPPPKSPAQIACERKGGKYLPAGKTGAKTCVRPTRDAGKQCRKASDCQGYCLARSRTCAPFTPIFGCQEVLDNEGRRMTLCID